VTRFHTLCAPRPSVASDQFVRRTITPKTAYTTNPAIPSRAVWTSPRLTGAPAKMVGRAKSGSASRPPTPSSENAVSPPTAVSVSNPAAVSMLNWTAAPAASPPGRLSVTALPASPAVTTANQPRVRSASRCRAKLQMKEISSEANASANQIGFSADRRGQAPSTAMRLGSAR
jgi:hypothetical protein